MRRSVLTLAFTFMAACTESSSQPPAQRPSTAAAQPAVRSVQISNVHVASLADGTFAIDLTASPGWPGRAQDPRLTINGTIARDYSFPAPHVMRFIVAQAHSGDQVALQFGDDVGSRIALVLP
jgi:hypothetical protein